MVMKLTTIASALSDATRIRLLLLLEERTLSVGELAAALDVVPSVVCHHLKPLLEAGLVRTVRRGRRTLVRRQHARWRQVLGAFEAP